MRYYTLFENPMPDVDEMDQLLHELWSQAKKECGVAQYERSKKTDGYVSSVLYNSHDATILTLLRFGLSIHALARTLYMTAKNHQ